MMKDNREEGELSPAPRDRPVWKLRKGRHHDRRVRLGTLVHGARRQAARELVGGWGGGRNRKDSRRGGNNASRGRTGGGSSSQEGLDLQTAGHSVRAGAVKVGGAEHLQAEIAGGQGLRSAGDKMGGAHEKARNAIGAAVDEGADVHLAEGRGRGEGRHGGDTGGRTNGNSAGTEGKGKGRGKDRTSGAGGGNSVGTTRAGEARASGNTTRAKASGRASTNGPERLEPEAAREGRAHEHGAPGRQREQENCALLAAAAASFLCWS